MPHLTRVAECLRDMALVAEALDTLSVYMDMANAKYQARATERQNVWLGGNPQCLKEDDVCQKSL